MFLCCFLKWRGEKQVFPKALVYLTYCNVKANSYSWKCNKCCNFGNQSNWVYWTKRCGNTLKFFLCLMESWGWLWLFLGKVLRAGQLSRLNLILDEDGLSCASLSPGLIILSVQTYQPASRNITRWAIFSVAAALKQTTSFYCAPWTSAELASVLTGGATSNTTAINMKAVAQSTLFPLSSWLICSLDRHQRTDGTAHHRLTYYL